jgi:archaemetzincin
MDRIILVLLSEINENLVDILTQHLEQTFSRQIDVRRKNGNLEYAYEADRKQYNSPRILSRLQRIKKGDGDKILGVVDADLYSAGYDFVYGEAKPSSGVATLSLYRLHPKNYTRKTVSKIFQERVIREALHEVGHLYGLGHCGYAKCVMRACTSLPEVDAAGNKFCSECTARL